MLTPGQSAWKRTVSLMMLPLRLRTCAVLTISCVC